MKCVKVSLYLRLLVPGSFGQYAEGYLISVRLGSTRALAWLLGLAFFDHPGSLPQRLPDG